MINPSSELKAAPLSQNTITINNMKFPDSTRAVMTLNDTPGDELVPL